MTSAANWTLLARILRPQGRKGEVLAELFTDFPSRFAEHPSVWIAPVGFTSVVSDSLRGAEPVPGHVRSHWLPVGRNAGRVVLGLTGVDTIEAAQALSGQEIVVPIEERLPLDPDAFYITDLLEATVFDGDRPLGVIHDVQFATTPDGSRRLDAAAPLLSVLSPEGREILLPFAAAYLVEIDLPNRAVRMALPAGLADINLDQSQQTPSAQSDRGKSVHPA